MRSAEPRALFVALLAASWLAVAPGSAWADCIGSGAIDDQGGEAAAACPGSGTDSSTRPAAGRSGPGCTPARADDPAAWWVSYDVPDEAIPGDGGGLSVRVLRPPPGQVAAVYRDCNGTVRGGVMWVPEPVPGAAGDGDGVFAARQVARARVEPSVPVFEVSPAQAVVRFPTWLWIDASYWQPASASATTPAGVAVSVEAVPVRVTWDLDEGVRVCEGPGIPWSRPAHDVYELQPEHVRGAGNPACTFTFVNASSTRESGVFDASVTVEWEFSWSLNGVDRGVFGTVEVSEPFVLRVGEVQTVLTG